MLADALTKALGVAGITREPARQVVAGVQVRHDDLLEAAGVGQALLRGPARQDMADRRNIPGDARTPMI